MSDEKNSSDHLNEMLDDAKETTKEVLSDGKNVAIIAHITLIGWVIALVMNNTNKNEFASFYIRQMLGLMIFALILSFVPVVGWVANIVLLILWVLSLISALGNEKKEIPLIGHLFQDWFKSL